jgi:hypothetical protein
MQKTDVLQQIQTGIRIRKKERAPPSILPGLATSEVTSKVRSIKQEDSAGMDKLAKRRAALKKLADFRDGVL